uniref:Ion_trans domain-containing protein n=1 Tax=Heterorhabditis bacteriophora TaxID=37862 RepID=A0A1I7WWU1_HETBA
MFCISFIETSCLTKLVIAYAFEEVFHARKITVIKKVIHSCKFLKVLNIFIIVHCTAISNSLYYEFRYGHPILNQLEQNIIFNRMFSFIHIIPSFSVIVCLFSNTRDSSREFLTAANLQGMNVNEFAYILPCFISHMPSIDGGKDVSPWIGPDGTMQQKVKDQYANSVIVSIYSILMT